MSYGYDSAGRLTSIGHTGPAGVIDSFNYTLDNNGNRTAVTSAEGTETYTLDALNRITAVAYPDGTTEAFAYDPAGNRTSHTQTDGTTVTYSHDAAGQLVSDSTGVNYSYDGAGNLIGTSAGDAYVYFRWGQLTSATIDGTTTTAAFDATGTRVSVDGVAQLWDRTGIEQLISTGDGDNYVHAPGMGVLRDGTSWLHRDAVGSVRHVTGPTGAVTASSAVTVFCTISTFTLRQIRQADWFVADSFSFGVERE